MANKNVLREVDDDARRLARRLVRAARFGALATVLGDGETPLASRVLVACDDTGQPLLLVSNLAAHARALAARPRCSILFGEPGPGDPLASPRISVFGTATPLDGDARSQARDRFLRRHPSAIGYCDFADFRFLHVAVSGASLNAGFARAYDLATADLVDPPRPDLRERLARAAAHMNEDHGDALDAIAGSHGGADGAGWRIVTGDARGFEMVRADALVRVEFPEPLDGVDAIRPAFVALARSA